MKQSSVLNNLEFNESKAMITVLFETSFTKEIRIAMHAGTQMKQHKTSFPKVVELVEGTRDIWVNVTSCPLQKEDLIALDASVPQDLKAKANSIVRLVLNKNDLTERVEKVIALFY